MDTLIEVHSLQMNTNFANASLHVNIKGIEEDLLKRIVTFQTYHLHCFCHACCYSQALPTISQLSLDFTRLFGRFWKWFRVQITLELASHISYCWTPLTSSSRTDVLPSPAPTWQCESSTRKLQIQDLKWIIGWHRMECKEVCCPKVAWANNKKRLCKRNKQRKVMIKFNLLPQDVQTLQSSWLREDNPPPAVSFKMHVDQLNIESNNWQI